MRLRRIGELNVGLREHEITVGHLLCCSCSLRVFIRWIEGQPPFGQVHREGRRLAQGRELGRRAGFSTRLDHGAQGPLAMLASSEPSAVDWARLLEGFALRRRLPNQAASVDAPTSSLFAFVRHGRPALPEHECWAPT